MLILNWNRISI